MGLTLTTIEIWQIQFQFSLEINLKSLISKRLKDQILFLFKNQRKRLQ